MQKSEEYLKDFWDIIKEANVYFEGVLEGKHIHKESLLEEIKAEKFPSWIKKNQPINAKGSKILHKKKKNSNTMSMYIIKTAEEQR